MELSTNSLGDLSFKRKFLLVLLLIAAAFFSVFGGFKDYHIDSEYHQTLYNKSYFLYNIYHLTSKVEYEIKKSFTQEEDFPETLKEFKRSNQVHGVSLYLVNGFFALLGIFFCFRLCLLLSQNFWLSYLAAWILSSSYFWNAESHYPTTDIPLSSLIITFLFFLFESHIKDHEFNTEERIYEGLFLGSCFAVKYAGLIILIPYLFFKFRKKELINSLQALIVSFIFLLVCISDKIKDLWYYSVTEIEVQTERGWAGYNSQDPAFLYHIKQSFFTEYGLALSILALIGIFYAFQKCKDDKKLALILTTIFIFMGAQMLMISSTLIKTVRFALPLIPFLAIFSALGTYQIYSWLKNLNHNLAKILTSIIILGSTLPALKNTLLHNHLMSKKDIGYYVNLLRDDIKEKKDALNIIMNIMQLFDKVPNKDDQEFIERCSSEPKDFKELYKFAELPNAVIALNSHKLDRFIFDEIYHCEPKRKAFKNFEDLKVLQLSPFKVEKEKVAFSFISMFSPRKPDLYYRHHKGAFFELFYANPEFTEVFRAKCEEEEIPCRFITGSESYFLNNIQTSFTDPKIRERLEQKKNLQENQ